MLIGSMVAVDDAMQFDPALKHAVLSRTGHAWHEASDAEEIAVIARLGDDGPVPGLRVLARFGPVVTGRVEIARIAEVRAHRAVHSLKASRAVMPSLAHSVPEIGATEVHAGRVVPDRAADPSLSITGRGVLVCVLDWHCDFAHANFRHPDGRTRLRFLWDQRGDAQPSSPSPFGYGRLLEPAEIDAALAQPDPYRALDYDPARADPTGRGSHGTHVLDIAAGNGRAPGAAPGVAPGADLGFVHLRGDDTRADDTLGDSVRLLEAVRFVVDRAGDSPCVINMSLGSHGGPHDGSTLVEVGLDHLLAERRGLAITMSTGNYFHARTHAREIVAQDENVDFEISVSDSIARPIEIEVWYSGEDIMHARLVDPDGRVVLEMPLGVEARMDGRTGPIATGYHRAHDPNNGDHVIDVFIWPGAPVGRWVLSVHGAWITRGRLDAWIERDDRGPQGRFPRRQARHTGTTGTICNGRHTIAVGAHDPRRGPRSLGRFSSCGPTRDGRRKPDIAAPGTAIVAARSTVIASGVRATDGLTTKSGTSMAAPHVCGAIALAFEAAAPRRLSIHETRRIVMGSARPIVGADPVVRMRLGHGLLDARAAVIAARSLSVLAGSQALDRPASNRDTSNPTLDDLRRALAFMRRLGAGRSGPTEGEIDAAR